MYHIKTLLFQQCKADHENRALDHFSDQENKQNSSLTRRKKAPPSLAPLVNEYNSWSGSHSYNPLTHLT